ncbi:MAG: NAD(P)H-hydrate dehydratase, partial [Clostridia bacterium]|nr:NAD(P)H-hydrate dehydratase [Clostridia bacterium]
AVAFGMGLGLGGDNLDYLKALLQEPITLIIDADGLNTLAQNVELLRDKKARVLITPHVKEFARLSGLTIDEILANPIAHALDFANRYGVVVLLKGADTVITDGIKTYLNARGTVGMATAGSGDVLSGILVGLAGYIDNPLEIGMAGAYVNGLAGEIALANNNNNVISMIATDTAQAIKEAISTILKEE